MQKSLFVAGLDYSITSAQLQELFAQYGSVKSASVITDRDTGQSKGFGFVDMENTTDAQACINALNGSTFKNRSLVVKEKEERAKTGNAGGFKGNNSRKW